MGWWTWEVTHSAAWVGFVFFCDLFPAVLITPWASALADKNDRFRILKFVLWVQVLTGCLLATAASLNLLTPAVICCFVFIEGALIGFSQPAFFGLVNRIVTKENLSAAVSLNSSTVQLTYVLGPLLAGFLFTFGLDIAPIAFAANAFGTLIYLVALNRIVLREAPPRPVTPSTSLGSDILSGLSVFWRDPDVYRATVLILSIAILQQPLIRLLPGINDYFELFTPAFFTILTAAFMLGSVCAGIFLASRNSDKGLERHTLTCTGIAISFYILLFIGLSNFPSRTSFSLIMLFLLGFSCSYVWTGNVIILQNRTPEELRSRVLGNNFMLARTVGAFLVMATGLIIENTNFTYGMLLIAMFVVVCLPLAIFVRKYRVISDCI